MQQYEYTIRLSSQHAGKEQDTLDLLSRDGWRLVTANHDYLYFERPVKPNYPTFPEGDSSY